MHHFIFITGKTSGNEFSSLKNVAHLVIETEIKTLLGWQLWYNYKLPALAKKHKAAILINVDGIGSLRTKILQFTIVQSLSFLQYPKLIAKKQSRFYKKNLPASLNKAKTIVAISRCIKNDLIENYQINEEKINIIYPGIKDLYLPVSLEEKESIKEKYADGKEFFLFTGQVDAINNLMILLKAFSFFKKRQKSNMQLLIATTNSPELKDLIESLKTYKYRSEVKLLEDLPEKELAKITAAAYTFVCPSLSDTSTEFLLQAMKSAVPVIVTDTRSFRETCADAALYANADDFADFADKLMLLFKDEKKRSELIENGKLQSQIYNWKNTAALLWQAIQKTVQL